MTGLGAIRNLDHTILLCADIGRMRDFYTTVMGFDVRTEIAGRWVELAVGSSSISLRGRTRSYDGEAPVAGTASVQFAFRISPAELDAAIAQLAAHGVELLEPVADLEPFGHRAFFFADPEDNIIEIYAEI